MGGKSRADVAPDDGVVAPSTEDFSVFFHAAWPRLFRVTLGVAGGDAGWAEDALQTAFANAYVRWDRIRATEHPEAYVRKMAVNAMLSVRRRRWWRAEATTDAVPELASTPSPETGVVGHDEVLAALRELPPRQRAVIVLRYYGGLSEAEIAEQLGCSRGTVKSQASDALAALRTKGITR